MKNESPTTQNPSTQDPATHAQEMPQQNPARQWTREQIIAAIKECAARLKRVPTQPELQAQTGLKEKMLRKQFGNYRKALRACGIEGTGPGFQASMAELFDEWAGIVREIGSVPSLQEYKERSRHSIAPLRRLSRYWYDVPEKMLAYLRQNGLEEKWADVLRIASEYRRDDKRRRLHLNALPSLNSRPQALKDRPLYGVPLAHPAMAFAPVNEMGVVFLFGLLATSLGFIVTWMGTEFPDCEAFREVEPGRWQRVLIEFEFLSRNFLMHGHNPAECDLIVCWEHNWKECPLQVLELKKFFTFQQVESTQQSAISSQHSAVSTQQSAVSSQPDQR